MMPFLYTFSEISQYLFRLSNEINFIEIIDIFDTFIQTEQGIEEDNAHQNIWYNEFLDNIIELFQFNNKDQWRVYKVALDTFNLIIRLHNNDNLFNKTIEFLTSNYERDIVKKLSHKYYIEQEKSIIIHIYYVLSISNDHNRFDTFEFYYHLKIFKKLYKVLESKYLDDEEKYIISQILKLITQIPDEEGFYLNILRKKLIMKYFYLNGDKNFYELLLLMICNNKINQQNLQQRILWLFYGRSLGHDQIITYDQLNDLDKNYILEILLSNIIYEPKITIQFYYILFSFTYKNIPELFNYLFEAIIEKLCFIIDDIEEEDEFVYLIKKFFVSLNGTDYFNIFVQYCEGFSFFEEVIAQLDDDE